MSSAVFRPREGKLAERLPTIANLARAAYWCRARDHTTHFDFLRARQTNLTVGHGAPRTGAYPR
ncbi:hypothetical protein ACQPZF_22495 [Actinosynnema sp. CS-041913]|uniref:hypothetical protein n=1 Tax=Actinosynnema sp. CS-041913 TaxID=3239917 RepID=UPI003D90D7F6